MILTNKSRRMLESVLFCVPAIAFVTLIIYIPFALSGYYALTEWNGIAKEPVFIGLQNFKSIFKSADTEFMQALWFTAKYTVVFVIASNVLALFLANALVKPLKTANVLRGVFFVPYIMSMTMVGFIWKFLFSQGFERLFELTGLEFLNLSWLGDPKLAFYSVAFVGVWQQLGFYIVLYIAGLQALPNDVLEAARVDGSTGAHTFFRIKLPLLIPSITSCVFMSLTNGLKVFDIILALTKGGPGGSTYSVTLAIYREAFQNNNYGMGAAQSLVFFFVVLLLTQLVLRAFKSRSVEL